MQASDLVCYVTHYQSAYVGDEPPTVALNQFARQQTGEGITG